LFAAVAYLRERALVGLLEPRLVLAGHAHWPHRSRLSERTQFIGLAHIEKGRDAFMVSPRRKRRAEPRSRIDPVARRCSLPVSHGAGVSAERPARSWQGRARG